MICYHNHRFVTCRFFHNFSLKCLHLLLLATIMRCVIYAYVKYSAAQKLITVWTDLKRAKNKREKIKEYKRECWMKREDEG